MGNKNTRKRSRLNQRLLSAPSGAVLTSAWFRRQGISADLAKYYVRAGWLHRVGSGAFTVQDETPGWLGAVAGLQQKTPSFHPGGQSALELAGLAHFLSVGDTHPLCLFSRAGDRLPAWFQNLPWANRTRHVATNFLPDKTGLREHREGSLAVMVSTPERAALEFLQHIDIDEAGYEHASLVFEGLGTLRPALLQSLLESCASVEVKRLFLHLAEKHAHAWLKRLNLKKIPLGSGKRTLVAGGRFDSKYQITVPAAATEAPSDAP